MSQKEPAHLTEHPAQAPDPEDDRKPDTPGDITKPSWKYILRTTVREYAADGCVDLAAGLTYRTVLSIFPALIAVVSILSLVGQSGTTVTTMLEQAEGVVPPDTWQTVEGPLESVLTAPAAGLGLAVGLLVALWSASSYIKGFARAMNTIYEVPEGRGPIKFNLHMYVLTAVVLILGALGAMLFALSGPVAEAVGDAIGLGSTAITVWNILSWLLLAAIVVFVVALLYYATPNVQQPKFRWMSIGALAAIVVSVLATAGFFYYVTNFGSYNATYGALAGVIILLLWLFIINAILLFGAELDSEIERGRQLQAGMAAEVNLQLPARDTKASDKRAKKFAGDIERGKNLRRTAGASQEDPGRGAD